MARREHLRAAERDRQPISRKEIDEAKQPSPARTPPARGPKTARKTTGATPRRGQPRSRPT